jgi:integrase
VRGTVITRRGHHSIVLDIGKDPVTGKRRQQWIATKGNKAEAVIQLNEMMHHLQHGTFVKPTKLTVRDHLTQWLDSYVTPNLSPATDETYRFIIEKHILPTLGNIVLSELQPQTVQKLYGQKLKSGLSAATVIKIHNILHKSLDNAAKTNLILRNPLDSVERPKEQQREMKTMSVTDILLLLDYAQTNSPYYPLYYTLIFTGLRRGEDLAIKWGDVVLLLLKISIHHSLSYLNKPRNGSRLWLKPPKTKKSKRFISITPSNAEVLREHYRKQNEERKSLRLPLLTDDDYVFCDVSGKPHLPNSITHNWIQLTRRVGLPSIRLHDCRHGFATLCLEQNVHPSIVANQLGHASVRTTLDRYSHVSPALQVAAAMKFEEIVMGTSGQNQQPPSNTSD